MALRATGADWVAGRGPREQPLWDEHAAFVDDAHARGRIVLAGPFTDGTGAIVIVDAVDAQDARRLLEGDPWVSQLDVLPIAAIRPWEVWVGDIESGS